jgi:hypothetical protein
MTKRSLRQNNKGQVLVISALLVALILLSTALYVIQTEKNVPVVQIRQSGFSAYQQSARNTVISALANTTNGGNSDILASDLSDFAFAVTAHSYQSLLNVESNPANTAQYSNGLWVSWGTSGHGVSSACCNFTFSSIASKTTLNMRYTTNVTSEVFLNGIYTNQTGNLKQVNLTVKLLNDGKGALAQNLTFYFDFDGSSSTSDWVKVDSPSTINNGDGTYTVSFTCETQQPNNPIYALVSCLDERGVLVKASVGCVEVNG